MIDFDVQVARVHAHIWATLASQGNMIGAHDAMIAATAIAHGHEVVTRNLRDFGRVPNLAVVVW